VSSAIFDAGFEIKNRYRLCYAYDLQANKYRKDIGSTHEVLFSVRFRNKTVREDRWLSGPRF
jgi:hypothetical protein